MKKLVLFMFLFVGIAGLNAQNEGKFRVGFDFGPTFSFDDGIGGLINIDVRYNVLDNMNIGLRTGNMLMFRKMNFEDVEDASLMFNLNNSILFAADYYFYSYRINSKFAPFIGGGFGCYRTGNLDLSAFFDNTAEGISAGGGLYPGVMVRVGFELKRFRMGLEYNIIPESSMENMNGEIVGQAKNSYLGFTLGFYLGGGETWGNHKYWKNKK